MRRQAAWPKRTFAQRTAIGAAAFENSIDRIGRGQSLRQANVPTKVGAADKMARNMLFGARGKEKAPTREAYRGLLLRYRRSVLGITSQCRIRPAWPSRMRVDGDPMACDRCSKRSALDSSIRSDLTLRAQVEKDPVASCSSREGCSTTSTQARPTSNDQSAFKSRSRPILFRRLSAPRLSDVRDCEIVRLLGDSVKRIFSGMFCRWGALSCRRPRRPFPALARGAACR